MAEKKKLCDLDVKQITAWLTSINLDKVLGTAFTEMQVDGELIDGGMYPSKGPVCVCVLFVPMRLNARVQVSPKGGGIHFGQVVVMRGGERKNK